LQASNLVDAKSDRNKKSLQGIASSETLQTPRQLTVYMGLGPSGSLSSGAAGRLPQILPFEQRSKNFRFVFSLPQKRLTISKY